MLLTYPIFLDTAEPHLVDSGYTKLKFAYQVEWIYIQDKKT